MSDAAIVNDALTRLDELENELDRVYNATPNDGAVISARYARAFNRIVVDVGPILGDAAVAACYLGDGAIVAAATHDDRPFDGVGLGAMRAAVRDLRHRLAAATD